MNCFRPPREYRSSMLYHCGCRGVKLWGWRLRVKRLDADMGIRRNQTAAHASPPPTNTHTHTHTHTNSHTRTNTGSTHLLIARRPEWVPTQIQYLLGLGLGSTTWWSTKTPLISITRTALTTNCMRRIKYIFAYSYQSPAKTRFRANPETMRRRQCHGCCSYDTPPISFLGGKWCYAVRW